MEDTKRQALAGLLVGLVPPDGSASGNQGLRELIMETVQERGHS